MISENDLLRIKTRFNDYVSSFYTGAEKHDAAIRIKEVHSGNVCLEILTLADSLALGKNDCYLAEICAVLHDMGRFEQFKKYGTYRDSVSENHALLGVSAIRSDGIIAELSGEDREIVMAAVEHHNRAVLPAHGSERFSLFLKLLRDADKIDIWRVVTEHYQGFNSSEVFDIGLPDTPEISDAVVRRILQGEIARVEDMKTLNDFKLLQMSWVFDLNFPHTFEIVKQRKYLEKLREYLPDDFAVERVFAATHNHLKNNIPDKRSVCQCQIP